MVPRGFRAQRLGVSHLLTHDTVVRLLLLLAGSSGSSSEGLQQQLQQLQRALQRAIGLDDAHVQELTSLGSSSSGGEVGLDDLQQLREVFAAPQSLEQVLQQHWQKVGWATRHLVLITVLFSPPFLLRFEPLNHNLVCSVMP